MNLVYTNRASQDLELSFVWYEKQRKGLGFNLLDCVEAAVKEIIAAPNAYQIYYSSFHGYVVRRFPFTIFYTIENDTVIIHSIFNNKKDPVNRP